MSYILNFLQFTNPSSLCVKLKKKDFNSLISSYFRISEKIWLRIDYNEKIRKKMQNQLFWAIKDLELTWKTNGILRWRLFCYALTIILPTQTNPKNLRGTYLVQTRSSGQGPGIDLKKLHLPLKILIGTSPDPRQLNKIFRTYPEFGQVPGRLQLPGPIRNSARICFGQVL